jgi:inner membrane transporter RhtA
MTGSTVKERRSIQVRYSMTFPSERFGAIPGDRQADALWQSPGKGRGRPKRVNSRHPVDRPYDRRMAVATPPAAPTDLARHLLDRTPAPLLVIGAALSVQCGAALATTLFEEAGALGAVWLRQAFGAAILIALSRGALRRLRGRPLAPVLALGGILAVMNSLFYESIDRVPLGVAVTAEFLGPLLVAALGSRRVEDFLWVLLAGGGVALLSSPSVDVDHLGLLLALGAGGCWALYIVVGKRLTSTWPLLDGLTVAMLVAAILIAPLGVASARGDLLDPSLLGVGVAVALLASVIPYLLELSALRRIRMSAFGILMSLEPAAAALAGALILSQRLSLLESVAIVLVIVASIGANRRAATVPPPA